MPKVTSETVAAETEEERRRRASTIVRRLRSQYDAVCGLNFENPLQLLVATILSAQATDAQVNRVTPALFERFPDAEAFADVSQEELEAAIASIGLFRNKAKSIRGACLMIVDEYDGEVPSTMKQLTRLPGVARKTANVVLGTAFGRAAGIAVDTHVQRIAYRLGLTEERKNTDRIERNLTTCIPRTRWIEAGHTIIWHGRRCCKARGPLCDECVCADLCPRNGVEEDG